MGLSEKIDALLSQVEKPVRYMGGEYGSVMKDLRGVDVRYAFLFPDVYEVGMSHLGMKSGCFRPGWIWTPKCARQAYRCFRWNRARPCGNSTYWALRCNMK